jgi:predicted amidohydrolase
MKLFTFIICLLVARVALAESAPTGMVRVAAIQCPSEMGKTAENILNITKLVRQAAQLGAKIVVLPECSVQGYFEPISETSWSSDGTNGKDVRPIAEPVPGPSTALFGRLADELNIYLCIGLVEAATNRFYNSQVLLSPDGKLVAHHRKKALWTPGDSCWCTPGDLPIQVVKTEFGNLGLMICFDFHALPPHLAKRQADIVLYSVGWYGPNEKTWFSKSFPAKAVIPYGFHVIAANWTSSTVDQTWPGRGHSCIITREGKVLAMSEKGSGNAIVLADLDLSGLAKKPPQSTTRSLTLP